MILEHSLRYYQLNSFKDLVGVMRDAQLAPKFSMGVELDSIYALRSIQSLVGFSECQ